MLSRPALWGPSQRPLHSKPCGLPSATATATPVLHACVHAHFAPFHVAPCWVTPEGGHCLLGGSARGDADKGTFPCCEGRGTALTCSQSPCKAGITAPTLQVGKLRL